MATQPAFGRKNGPPTEPEEESSRPTVSNGDPIDLGAMAYVFAIFGILGLVTSAIFLIEREVIIDTGLRPTQVKPLQQGLSVQSDAQSEIAEQAEKPNPNDTDSKYPVLQYSLIGPFRINASSTVLTIDLKSSLPINTWSFIEAELLDHDKDYIFSFGDELWHENGYDDGPWEEAHDNYGMKLTIPSPGAYYINIKTQGSVTPNHIAVRVSRRLGSSIPHFAFGMISLMVAFVLNETKNRTAMRLIKRMNNR